MSEAAAPPADLAVSVGGISCRNPVWVSSGCFNYGREFSHLYPLRSLGAICTKGTSRTPWPGNPGVRFTETPSGMLAGVGLMNPGVEHFLATDGPWLRQQGATVVANIAGHSVEDYVAVAERLTPELADAVEINVSCPNTRHGGMHFGVDPAATHAVTRAVRAVTRLPLLVKLSPNVTNIAPFAQAAEAAGADAISLINSPVGMAIDIYHRRPVMGNVAGGLCGPAVKPIALHMVWQAVGAVKIPVVGVGGIATWQDAVEFLLAGASAVQVGSACLFHPMAPLEIIQGIAAYVVSEGFGSVGELIGLARSNGGGPGQ